MLEQRGSERNEEGWQEVRQNRVFRNLKPSWDTFPLAGRFHNQGIQQPKVTILEIPYQTNAKELFDLFGCIGIVLEVSISPRRNNIGKRFRFARFIEVEDERMLRVQLDNVQVLRKKIHANVSKISKGWY